LAANEDVPAEPALKTPDQWVYIGKSFPRKDVKNKTVGAPNTYTIDFNREGMLTATVARSPRFGGTVKSFDATEAKKVAGVVTFSRSRMALPWSQKAPGRPSRRAIFWRSSGTTVRLRPAPLTR
jgi:hypothetical protein